MESSEDKQWASRYLLDPLTAPEPSAETGPGTHHITTATPAMTSPSASVSRKPVASASVRSVSRSDKDGSAVSSHRSNNPYRNGNSTPSSTGFPTPPSSGSPATEHFPEFSGLHVPSNRVSQASTQIPTSTGGVATTASSASTIRTRDRRSSSLNQRFPGDQSHRPLDMLRQSSTAANRSPHLRKRSHVGADSIDTLDNVAGAAYHHEGPYDATLLARNQKKATAPVAAVAGSNREALRATPREKVLDSVLRHVPLDGVAFVPPGEVGRDGRRYFYREGEDLMREGNPEGGAYKRWPGVIRQQYHPSDLKGKGEPAYSLEKALKTHKRNASEGQRSNYEMVDSPTTTNPRSDPHPRTRPNGITTGRRAELEGSGHRGEMEGSGRGAALEGGELRHRRSADAVSTASSMRAPPQQNYKDWEAGAPRGAESGTGARLRRGMGSLRIGGRE
ncbi:uncharacterized protein KY384_008560 [Bacidia gigantensis]|uniref:uncharacterized protein n=1 Tax=Bacidia gigantensis TaxID=2732470 RepID=UPI001D0416A0|nr:uncharacterized protein KY384_008560 [Bacidia gigantensis]KAG8527131.1 hypothetical protein KY384_008560 [Bacidia gigantensis]